MAAGSACPELILSLLMALVISQMEFTLTHSAAVPRRSHLWQAEVLNHTETSDFTSWLKYRVTKYSKIFGKEMVEYDFRVFCLL